MNIKNHINVKKIGNTMDKIHLIWILILIFTHWVADFVCQTDYMATGKSKEWKPLLTHTFIYSFIFLFVTLFIGGTSEVIGCRLPGTIMWLAPITFVFHTATDYYTSRVNSMFWEKKEVHNFFTSIGFDQFLHYAQLLITFYLLSK
jgi:Protein of unknown function (DUF3307)